MAFSAAKPVPDADYYLERAAAEAELADHAKSPRTEDLHHKLASQYLGMLFGDTAVPAPPDREAKLDEAALEGVARALAETPLPPPSDDCDQLLRLIDLVDPDAAPEARAA